MFHAGVKMRIWRASWHCPKDDSRHELWFETREAAAHTIDEWDGELQKVEIDEVRVPCDSRREFVKWLNTHFSGSPSVLLGTPRGS